MKSLKRDLDLPQSESNPFDHVSPDQELFLQAFEKPTQIYRFLRTRQMVSPVFLNRNLLYMKKRLSRPRKTGQRSSFSVDSLLDKYAKDKTKRVSYKSDEISNSMNLEFHGFYSQDLQNQGVGLGVQNVRVEVRPVLVKVGPKRKDAILLPPSETELGKVEVPYNGDVPRERESPSVFVGSEHFKEIKSNSGKSLILAIRAYCKRKKALLNGHCIGDVDDASEPKSKRSKTSRNQESADHESKEYSAELVVYNKQDRCILMDGYYELAMQEMRKSEAVARNPQEWESFGDGELAPFEILNNNPVVKFHLTWSKNSNAEESLADKLSLNDPCNNNIYGKNGYSCDDMSDDLSIDERAAQATKLFYQFNYHNNTRQQTESRDDHVCPWCLLDCIELYSLLKHLRLCHARFNFTYTPDPKGARIDVTINDCYDGSYVGNPQDLHSNIGYAFSRKGPARRTPVTYITVYRPKRRVPSLSEFLEHEEPETGRNRQIFAGHNRLYYHTVTNQPIRPEEIHQDSEEENDPEWLRQKTINLIDEFTDVNAGEKEVMKMWNLHIMQHNYIGDCQLPVACQTFVYEYGPQIYEKNLRKNFLLHLVNLYDFSLVRSETVIQTIVLFDQLCESIKASKSDNID